MEDSTALVIAVFIVLFVVGFAGGPLLEPLLLTRAFGIGSFATILGAMFMLETTGLLVSPAVAGAIFDATDSYDWALVMFAVSAGLSLLLFALASTMARPVDAARRGSPLVQPPLDSASPETRAGLPSRT
ncbi:MAG TPA: hypothetical protein QGF05_15105 [Dehalococcoidia bacterium]|nr:hypothetical protein [Dehalococcoidia bacterium]